MSKIERFNGEFPVFAQDATDNYLFNFGMSNKEDFDGTLTSMMNDHFKLGWETLPPSGFPPKQWFNSSLRALSQSIAYLHQMGVPEYNASQTYFLGSQCIYNGKAYTSLKTDNQGNLPTNTFYWVANSKVGHKHDASDITSGTIDQERLPSASTSESGISQLSNNYTGTSQTKATTEKALSDGLDTKVDKTEVDINATEGKVVRRDGNGDINARLFRSTYSTQSSINSDAQVLMRNESESDNFMRPVSMTVVKQVLGINDKLNSSDAWKFSYKVIGNATTPTVLSSLSDDGLYRSNSGLNLFSDLPSELNGKFAGVVEQKGISSTGVVEQFLYPYNLNKIFYRRSAVIGNNQPNYDDWIEFITSANLYDGYTGTSKDVPPTANALRVGLEQRVAKADQATIDEAEEGESTSTWSSPARVKNHFDSRLSGNYLSTSKSTVPTSAALKAGLNTKLNSSDAWKFEYEVIGDTSTSTALSSLTVDGLYRSNNGANLFSDLPAELNGKFAGVIEQKGILSGGVVEQFLYPYNFNKIFYRRSANVGQSTTDYDDWIEFITSANLYDGYTGTSTEVPPTANALRVGLNTKVDNADVSASSVGESIAKRTGQGDLNARLFKCEYEASSSTIPDGASLFYRTSIDDNFIRPATLAAMIKYLGIDTKLGSAGYGASAGVNGHLKLPTSLGGFIIQWGQATAGAVGTSVNNSFSLSFPTFCASVIAIHAGSGTAETNLAVSSKTKTSFALTSAYHTNIQAYYIAIGY